MFPDNFHWFDSPSSCSSLSDTIETIFDETPAASILSEIDSSSVCKLSLAPKMVVKEQGVGQNERNSNFDSSSKGPCSSGKINCQSNSVFGRILKLEESLLSFDNKVKKQASEINLLNLKTSNFKGKNVEVPIDIEDPMDLQGNGILQFVFTHLQDPNSENVIHWTNKNKTEFLINDPQEFAKMWGEEKKKEKMTKKKLYRSLTYQVNLGKLTRDADMKFKYKVVGKIDRQKSQAKTSGADLDYFHSNSDSLASTPSTNVTYGELINQANFKKTTNSPNLTHSVSIHSPTAITLDDQWLSRGYLPTVTNISKESLRKTYSDPGLSPLTNSTDNMLEDKFLNTDNIEKVLDSLQKLHEERKQNDDLCMMDSLNEQSLLSQKQAKNINANPTMSVSDVIYNNTPMHNETLSFPNPVSYQISGDASTTTTPEGQLPFGYGSFSHLETFTTANQLNELTLSSPIDSVNPNIEFPMPVACPTSNTSPSYISHASSEADIEEFNNTLEDLATIDPDFEAWVLSRK